MQTVSSGVVGRRSVSGRGRKSGGKQFDAQYNLVRGDTQIEWVPHKTVAGGFLKDLA